jgi:hypothetical protein
MANLGPSTKNATLALDQIEGLEFVSVDAGGMTITHTSNIVHCRIKTTDAKNTVSKMPVPINSSETSTFGISAKTPYEKAVVRRITPKVETSIAPISVIGESSGQKIYVPATIVVENANGKLQFTIQPSPQGWPNIPGTEDFYLLGLEDVQFTYFV